MNRSSRGFLPLLICLFATVVLVPSDLPAQNNEPAEAKDFKIIVHVDNPALEMAQDDISKMFLGKMKGWKGWDDSPTVMPVDLPAQSEIRIAFTSAIHKKNMSSISSYWQRMIFSGRGSPPDQAASDQEIIAFVAKNPGSIGYVSSSLQLKPTETDPAKMTEQDKLKAKVKTLKVVY